jgi:hypothetical protein
MHQRRRIVILFGAGIVLPSLLLGYLAFRGIQNDRALLEKERLEDIRRTANQVIGTVDDEITAVETALDKIVAGQSGTPSPESAAALNKLAADSQLVEQFFNLQGLKNIDFPIAKLLYIPPPKSRPLPSGEPKRFRGIPSRPAAGVPGSKLSRGPGRLPAGSGPRKRPPSHGPDIERCGQNPKEIRTSQESRLDL